MPYYLSFGGYFPFISALSGLRNQIQATIECVPVSNADPDPKPF
jgi:hypothetical protein